MLSKSSIEENKNRIFKNIKKACRQSKRNPKEIELIAITKGFPKEIWKLSKSLNLFSIGESKVLEAERKNKFYKQNQLKLHFIGHLQTNKTKKAIELFNIIQTVDSIKLAKKINKISLEKKIRQNIFIQVKTEEDPNKYGFKKKNIYNSVEEISTYKGLNLIGVMTIPPINQTDEKIRIIYRKTRKIRDKIKSSINNNCKYLSMGMSNDYEIAILEGATHIRLGTALFGERKK